MLSIEVWDTGIGIPEKDYQAIFGEFHQLDNAARERSRGLGLGLSIVQRSRPIARPSDWGTLRAWQGSVFTIDVVVRPSGSERSVRPLSGPRDDARNAEPATSSGEILVVEDDPEMRQLLELLLKGEGHRVATAPDGVTAQAMLERGAIRPDLILTDFNLPNGLNGLQLAANCGRKSMQIPGHHSDRRYLHRDPARYRAPELRAAQ